MSTGGQIPRKGAIINLNGKDLVVRTTKREKLIAAFDTGAGKLKQVFP